MTLSTAETKLEELFGADLRSLAALRIGTASLVLWDLFQRSQDLVAHYTDFGVLPRTAAFDALYSRWMLSLHFMNGTWEFQALLVLIAAVFAFALLVGYKTRLATIISWILLISLDARNVLLAQGADTLLRLVLFWAIFLPWGARVSVDSGVNPLWKKVPYQCLTWGTFAYQMQIVFMYWFSALFKKAPEWRTEGTAIYYTLSIDSLTSSVGQYLLQFPDVMKGLTHTVFWFEIIGPALLFFPVFTGLIRTLVSFCFIVMQIGFGLCLVLGLFPWISAVCMIAFLPSWFWEKVVNSLRRAESQVKIYYDQDCGFCFRSVAVIQTFFLLRENQLLPARSDPLIEADMKKINSWVVVDSRGVRHFSFRGILVLMNASSLLWPFHSLLRAPAIARLGEKAYRFVSRHRNTVCRTNLRDSTSYVPGLKLSPLANALVIALLAYVFLWNWQGIPGNEHYRLLSERMRVVGYILRLDQSWNMFAPYPTKEDGWFVVVGRLNYGGLVDLFGNENGKDVSWEKPALVSSTYKNQHWWRYMRWLWVQRQSSHPTNYARYLCRRWNSNHARFERLDELAIFFIFELTLPDYQHFEPRRTLISRHKCEQAQ